MFALAAVSVAVVLSRMRPERIVRILNRLNRSCPEASEELCSWVRAAVCNVSLTCRGPKGCLHRSIATAIGCRLMGASATWCTGFALAPFRAHAWVELEGNPIDEAEEVADYVVVLMTSPPRGGE
ncbi:lasso peptide biosynthesis B2 protein [Rothia halotolerans]|uniref:lasso peptide biosynthesis B2 protein n=1 Tax=Rothia halotolerans TaxID=405770 RepID=UPI003B514537